MIRIVAGLAFAVSLSATACVAASAQDARQDEPGKFDFYVLSLSWSPSYCAAAMTAAAPAARNAGRGLIRSSCTGCGRNMKRDFRNIVCSRHRGFIMASWNPCSI